MRLRKPLESAVLILFPLVLIAGCGDGRGGDEGTVFDPPAWVNALGDVSSDGDSGTTGSGETEFRGIRATVTDVAEPYLVPEVNVVDNSTAVNRVITATGNADDGETLVTMSWTVLSNISPPDTLVLVAGPPAGLNEAGYFYSENLTDGTGQPVTDVTSGELVLDKWNDLQVRGTFSAEIILQDGTVRTVSDGIINVRF